MNSLWLKKGIAGFIAVFMTASLAACGARSTDNTGASQIESSTSGQTEVQTTEKKEPITIKYPTYRVGEHLGAPSEKKVMDDFVAKYNGEIKLEVEEIPSDQAYLDKMKILASSGDLPDVVEGKNGVDEVLAKSGYMLDLLPELNADNEWKQDIGEGAIKVNMVDGKEYFVAWGGGSAGYFYNKEYFEKVGIKPAETWDEFLSNCEKLKAAGITPLALMSGENAWTTNLFLGSIVGTSGEAGNQFMNSLHPKNFETPEFIDALKKIQIMFQKYTTKDALGAAYANAANNFQQGKTAMIANGPWMISDFSDATKSLEGFDQKVGIAIYPGSGVFSAINKGGFGVASKDKDKQEAAIKFVKFRTGAHAQQINLEMTNQPPLTARVKISDDYKAKNPLASQLIEMTAAAKYKYSYLDDVANSNVIEAFKTLYPELVYNKITAEQMAKKLSDLAAKTAD